MVGCEAPQHCSEPAMPDHVSGGCWLRTGEIGQCRCHMRRSIKACSFKPVAFSRKTFWPICAAVGSCGVQKTSSTSEQTRGQIIDTISIWDRPAEIEDCAITGHWEGDLLSGAKNTHIATLVERTSRFVMLVHLSVKDSQTVVDAPIQKVCELPRGLMTSLTWDRGLELAYHKQFTVATDVMVYFCDPQALGNVGAMKIPMASCASIIQKALIFQLTTKMVSIGWFSILILIDEKNLAS